MENMVKIVSVITVNLNNLEGLKRTMNSVLLQTFRDYEYIIVDGGSKDGSREYIEQYKEGLAYWCSEADTGIYNAMNKAVSKASGEYVCFMNSGDCFYSNKVLEDVFSSEQTADILYGDVLRTKNGEKVSQRIFPKQITAMQMFLGGITHQAIFSRRILHLQHPYDEKYKMIADWNFLIRRLMDGCEFKHVGEFICCYDITGYSCTTRTENDIHEQQFQNVLDELFPKSVQSDIKELISLKNADFSGVVRQTAQMGLKGKIISVFVKFISKLPSIK